MCGNCLGVKTQIWNKLGCFSFFILKMVYCVYSLESPHR